MSNFKEEIRAIENKLKGKKSLPIDIKNYFSLLIPLININGSPHLLFENRAMTLRNQPGEVSFPGGKIEKGESPREAAIRESCEELLIHRDKIKILGKGDYLINPYRAIIYSHIGLLDLDFEKISPYPGEVESVFTIPLSFFMKEKPSRYTMKVNLLRDDNFPYELIMGGKNYKWQRADEEVYFYTYGKNIVWGLTAKMTYNFVKNLQEKN
ncbi:CoA pyrophosphatase [uncultured Peptoniphilus sp.]|uniref:NUDIX hydrolase n=1 Tax=uncultured Peptoniphilus sp. TaxID=254354 RepID=UPI002804084A|nr:CoA pyrophosphatase [uncultured Peptoniphilus sp.]